MLYPFPHATQLELKPHDLSSPTRPSNPNILAKTSNITLSTKYRQQRGRKGKTYKQEFKQHDARNKRRGKHAIIVEAFVSRKHA